MTARGDVNIAARGLQKYNRDGDERLGAADHA
jgi:hypothetical protein